MTLNPNYLGLEGVLGLLENVRPSGSQYTARCPAHDDQHSSLTVAHGRQRVILKCHAGEGCSFEQIAAALNVPRENFFEEGKASKYYQAEFEQKPKGGWEKRIEKVYPYVDADGKLLFETVRLGNPKDFRQRRPDGKGGYVWNLQGVTRVLYRLPQVREAVAAGRPVFLVEGEKDVETLERFGLTATTAPMGAEKWDESYDRALVGAQLYILPDNDEAGRRHVIKVAVRLHGKADCIKILDLPGLPPKGDVSDWFAAGGTFDEFSRLLRELQPWSPGPRDGLPEIIVTNRPLRDLIDDAQKVLERANTPPRIFVRLGMLTRWRHNEKGRALIEPLTAAGLRNRLSEAADWLNAGRNGLRHTPPPDNVINGVMAAGQWALPALENITEMPVLRPDGSVLDVPGYDTITKLVYAPAGNLSMPSIPERPTFADVQAALSLLDEVYGELPYVDEASRANGWAAILTPILRSAIQGRVPLALINAPQAGTGKSTFAELCCILGTGREGAMITAPEKEEEWGKKLTATFMEGATMVVIDNIEGLLVSPSLAAALTMAVWKDRVLGASTMVEVPIQCSWIATGNNVELGGDLPRRCYPINLDARVSQPWKRTGYKHPHPQTWALANRGRLVAAALTIARYWFAEGCPTAKVPTMGGFEEWSRILGNVLAIAGINGFLGNLEEMYTQANPTAGQWEAFLEAWHDTYGNAKKKLAEVTADLQSTSSKFAVTSGQVEPAFVRLREAIPDDLNIDVEGSPDSLKKRLGKALSKKTGVRHGDNQLHVRRVTDPTTKTELWSVWNGEGTY